MKKISKSFKNLLRTISLLGPYETASFFLSKVVPRSIASRWFITAQVQGSAMMLDARDPGISKALIRDGVREIYHLHQIWANIGYGMTGIDLGANIGYYALMEAQIIGDGGRVYCIEPEPENVRMLRENIRVNSHGRRCIVIQCAVGDRDGIAEFQLSGFSNRHGMSKRRYYGTKNNDAASSVIQVPMVTIDTFMEQNSLVPNDIQFIRMDIEGYEVMAFQGMKKLLEASTPLKVFIEFHPKYYNEWGWTFAQLLDFLESYGLVVRSLAYERGKRIPILLQNPNREAILASVEDSGNATGGSHALLERT